MTHGSQVLGVGFVVALILGSIAVLGVKYRDRRRDRTADALEPADTDRGERR